MIDENDLNEYVEKHIEIFHNNRIMNISNLKLTNILKHKNPYLFRAKNILNAGELIKTILDAHLSSAEETMFGEFLESLAIYICGMIYGGVKSSSPGIDLEFNKENKRYIVSIKSGPNWGNSRQVAKMIDDFNRTSRIIRSNNKETTVIAINGCCYGKDDKPDKGSYFKLCGQRFWEFISCDEEMYTKIIVPLGYKAKEKNDNFYAEYSKLINNFTAKFIQDFCDKGVINWNKLLQFNSGKKVC